MIRQLDDKRSLISVHQLKGLAEWRSGAKNEALELLNEGLRSAEELKVKEEELSLNLDFGGIYLDLENIEKAGFHLSKARKILDEHQSPVWQPELDFNMGKLNWIRNEKKSAEKLFLIALDEAVSLNRPEMVWKIHHILGKLYLDSYQIEKAYRELEKAGMVLRKITDEIKDSDLKKSYLNDDKKNELLSDVRKITQILAGKTAPFVT